MGAGSRVTRNCVSEHAGLWEDRGRPPQALVQAVTRPAFVKSFDTKGADVHKVRPVVRAAVQAGKAAQAKVNERDRAELDQRQVRRLGLIGLKLAKG